VLIGRNRDKSKQWAASNPAMAEAKKLIFLADPNNQQSCSSLPSWNPDLLKISLNNYL
jgi:hypothetical protein